MLSPPTLKSAVVRALKVTSCEQREEALRRTGYNTFSYPADLLYVDLLSDSGTTVMEDSQFSLLFLGDESYGRNRGYYVLLGALSDVFDPGAMKFHLRFLSDDTRDVAKLCDELYLVDTEGGFVNTGLFQLERPNVFLVPQGRCAEHLLYSSLKEVLPPRPRRSSGPYVVINNCFFDTTRANAIENGFTPINCFDKQRWMDGSSKNYSLKENPFFGNMDTAALKGYIEEYGSERIAAVVLTITNNTVAGQPVSMANIEQVQSICRDAGIALLFDACRFAENAYFIQQAELPDLSIEAIVKRMFSCVDGFTISFKKDGCSNIGGALCLRDKGVLLSRFPRLGDTIKQKQIVRFGNDSYGAMSGRDLLTIAKGLYLATSGTFLHRRISQVVRFAASLDTKGIPVCLPAGGHAVYLDMSRFLGAAPSEDPLEFRGVGLVVELIRQFGIRCCELGAFAFELDLQTDSREGDKILNLVRLAIPRNAYNDEHLNYVVEALARLHTSRETIPAMRIVRGKTAKLRHFVAQLEPVRP